MNWERPRPKLMVGKKLAEPTYHTSAVFLRVVAQMEDTRSPRRRSKAQELDYLLEAIWKHSASAGNDRVKLATLLQYKRDEVARASQTRSHIETLRRLVQEDKAATSLLDQLANSRTCRAIHVSGPRESLANYLDDHTRLVGTRGKASDPTSQWRGACVAALDELLPPTVNHRYSTIAALLEECGMPCTRHQTRGIIESRQRRKF
jgi:hypothetical protein